MTISRRQLLLGGAAVAAALAVTIGPASATTLAQSFGTSTAMTLNATAWAQAVTISSNAVSVAGLSPVADDILITVTGTVPNSTLADQFAVNVWIAISEDGTHYTNNDQYSGTNNTQATLRSPTNFLGPFAINCTQNVAFYGVIPSLRAICGGTLPRAFGIILENQTGQTLTAPAATYTPINWTNT